MASENAVSQERPEEGGERSDNWVDCIYCAEEDVKRMAMCYYEIIEEDKVTKFYACYGGHEFEIEDESS